MSWYQKKHSPTHHPDHPIFILFHLPRSIHSSLFKLCAWQSFCTTSLHVLFGLPLGLEPSTSYSIHFFTPSAISYQYITRNAWQSPVVACQAQRTNPGEDTPLQQSNRRICCLCNVTCNDGIPFHPHRGGVMSAQRIFRLHRSTTYVDAAYSY